MLDAIYIALTGLNGFEQGLRVIANNTANLNTPGFKSAMLQYADLFYNNGLSTNGGGATQFGLGLSAVGTALNFVQGEIQNTGNALDVAVDGLGMFVLRNDAGQLR
jgi:flagellar hook protein FlgE